MLTDTAIKNAKHGDKTIKMYDEGGLYLLLHPANGKGGKWWRFKYRFEGKEKLLSFGTYPEVSLKDARNRRDEAKKLLANNEDPAEVRKAQNAVKQIDAASTFEAVAMEWFKLKIMPLSASHSGRTLAYLKNDLIPYLGQIPIDEIKAPALLECLRRIAARKNKQGKPVTETANRVREQMGQLWRYAIATGKAERDIAADLRGALEAHVQKNFSHITDPKLLGLLLRDIEGYGGAPVTVAALRILPMVFTRPMELRTARWADINFETKEWRFFSSKTKIDHIVPLASQVVEQLKSLYSITGMGEYVFGVRSGLRPLSEITINQALKSLGYGSDIIHPHGFRHTAATMLAEMGWDENTIDRQLSHLVQGVKGVYQKAKYIDDRRKMMQAWADYLDQLKLGAQVISLKTA
ncbi:integrase arm-type DNA-binding domain-containing protein [Undibacterium seohonense]|uniref:Integrase arm-type DNA-binding domain-containing protein n=1 Tax=Undibacterium seohonense TaxID=1344950 RepID=A0ABR6X0D2_9BURK|nr:integrase arm-type DNA-binding domain-containing protein [Undibacterium seohonense]MBC3805784.1 integrase arm-type DNA-binding domain-containing protein [Undibacterium seohonense]